MMKNSTQITGLPIISILNGVQEGVVQSLIINPEKGSVDFLALEQEEWQESMQAIPFKKVIGVGEYAVTIESANSIIDLNEIPIASELVNKKIAIIDTNVITRKGELLGKVIEYMVNAENGEILGLRTLIQEEEAVILAEYVLTFGKDIIIVKEEAGANLQFLESKEEKAEETATFVLADELLDESAATVVNDEEQRLQALKEKQIELLLNKVLTKDIHTSEGELFLAAGTVLTLQNIEKAQHAGPSVVIDLSMNVEA